MNIINECRLGRIIDLKINRVIHAPPMHADVAENKIYIILLTHVLFWQNEQKYTHK